MLNRLYGPVKFSGPPILGSQFWLIMWCLCYMCAMRSAVDRIKEPGSKLWTSDPYCSRGEKLNYKSVTKEISKPPFFGSRSPVGIKVYRVCSIHVSFKCFEQRPYLVCHMTTIENVLKLGLSGSFLKCNNTFCQNTALSTTCSMRLRKCTIFWKL